MNSSTSIGRVSSFLIVASLAIHCFFGFTLNLSTDEAHYALYAYYPDWSYFDHPPLVGWVQMLPVYLNAPDGILRFIPELLWLLVIFLVRINTSKMIDLFGINLGTTTKERAKNWGTISLCLAPLLHVMGVGLLPDTLLIFFVSCMTFVGLKLVELYPNKTSNQDFLWWILLGILFGLSGLSKYTSIFFALAIGICLIAWLGLGIFKRPGLWVGLFIAALFIQPVIYWNSKNEWISFIYQFQHGTGNAWQARRIAVFLLNQILSYGLLPIIGLWFALRNRIFYNYWLISLFALPFLLFAYLSGGGGSLPHWTSATWVALTPIFSCGLAIAWENPKRRLIKLITLTQVGICTLGFTLLWYGAIPFTENNELIRKKNPIADLYGWNEAAQRASELARTHQSHHLAVQNWTLASKIAWYARPLKIYVLDSRQDQFDIWFGALPKGGNTIVINWSNMSFPTPTKPGQFSSCEPIEKLPIKRHNQLISEFEFLFCKEWGQESAEITKNHAK